jgi:hypothetical protein
MAKKFPDQILMSSADFFNQISSCLHECLRFAIVCLSHKQEIVRISALKLLKFILESIGCQLDYGMVFILKAMLAAYPINSIRWNTQDEFDLEPLFGKDISIVEYLFKFKRQASQMKTSPPTKF